MLSDEPKLSREQLHAIRRTVAVAREQGFTPRLVTDLEALLSEVERLTVRCEVLQELADRAASEQGLAQRRMEQAQQARNTAFQRGVAAMRAAVVDVLETHDPDNVAWGIENISNPEDKL